MKVKIGPYPNRWISNIHTNYMNDKYGYIDWPKEYTRFERFLEKFEDLLQSIYNCTINLFIDRREQKVKVHIDRWDTWSMDHTLAEIVLPMLIQLRDTAHGSSMVDDEDVPHLAKRGHGSNESAQWDLFACEEHDHQVWEQCHTRWQWVLNEMIYAFDCKVNKDDVYMRFRDDLDAARKEQDRIANGFRLFGKYYEGLWD